MWRDALVAGVYSDIIHAGRLQLDDNNASLTEYMSLTNADELSTNYSRQLSNDSPSVNAMYAPEQLTATGKSGHQQVAGKVNISILSPPQANDSYVAWGIIAGTARPETTSVINAENLVTGKRCVSHRSRLLRISIAKVE